MRPVLVLVLKDLRRRLAEPSGIIISLAIPLAIATTMFLAFGGRGRGKDAVPALRLMVVDLDGTPASGIVSGASQNPDLARRLHVAQAPSRDEGLRRLHEEDFAAMLVIPKGFSDSLLEGRPAELELIKNPSQSIMPVVAEQGAEVLTLYLSAAARLLGDDAPRLRRLFEGEGWDDATGIAAMVTATYARVRAADDLLFPPIIEVRERKGEAESQRSGFDFLSWMFPGSMVMGLLFVAMNQMRDLLRERETGTLRRLCAAPIGAGQVLLAKVLAVAAGVSVCLAILLLAGSAGFGIHWGPPGPLLATSALLVLAATGFAAFLFALVRTERQGDAIGGILIMVMSLMGGSLIPPQVFPEWLRRLSAFTVNYWGQEALRGLASGGGWDSIGASLAVMAAMGGILTLLGTLLLRRRHMRGAL